MSYIDEDIPMNEWHQKEQNAQRIAFVNDQLTFPLELLWQVDFGKAETMVSAPIIANGMVYVCSSKQLYAVDLATGTYRWSFQPQMPVSNNFIKNSPTYCQGRVFFADPMGIRYCLDAITGQLIWQSDNLRAPDETFCIFKDRMFTTFGWKHKNSELDYEGCMSFDIDNNILWKFDTSNVSYMLGVSISDNKLIFGDNQGTIWALHPDNGAIIWEIHLREAEEILRTHTKFAKEFFLHSLPIITKNVIIARVGGAVHTILDINTGSMLWNIYTGRLPIGCNEEEIIFFDDSIRKFRRIDLTNRSEYLSTADINLRAVSTVAHRALMIGNTYLAGFNRPQALMAYDITSGNLLWRFDTEPEGSGFSASPAYADKRIVIGSDAGNLYCFGSR